MKRIEEQVKIDKTGEKDKDTDKSKADKKIEPGDKEIEDQGKERVALLHLLPLFQVHRGLLRAEVLEADFYLK